MQVAYKPKPGYELTPAQFDLLQKYRFATQETNRAVNAFVNAYRQAHPVVASGNQQHFSEAGLEEHAAAEEGGWTTYSSASEESLFEAISDSFHSSGSNGVVSSAAVANSGRSLLRTNH